MTSQSKHGPEQRRFLAINYWVGTRDNGFLVGPTLVSTRDYRRFHYWDEPGYAMLAEDDYEVVKVYPLGLSYDEVVRQFMMDFAPPSQAAGPHRSAGYVGPDGTFYSLEGWGSRGLRCRERRVIVA